MRLGHRFWLIGVAGLFLLIHSPRLIHAQQTYHWVDAQGGMHFTDNPGAVPPEYRNAVGGEKEAQSKNETRNIAESPVGNPPGGGGAEGGRPKNDEAKTTKAALTPYLAAVDSAGTLRDNFGHDESYWRDRKKFWEKRLEDSQRLHEEATRKFNFSLQRHYTANEYQRMKNAKEDMVRLQADVEEAHQMLDAKLKEEARKAGAPPGWVR